MAGLSGLQVKSQKGKVQAKQKNTAIFDFLK